MGKLKSQLGCVSSLFTCFRSQGNRTKKKKKKQQQQNNIHLESPETADGQLKQQERQQQHDLDDDETDNDDQTNKNGASGGGIHPKKDRGILSNGFSGSGTHRNEQKNRVSITTTNGGENDERRSNLDHDSIPQSPRSESSSVTDSAISKRQGSVYYDAFDGFCDDFEFETNGFGYHDNNDSLDDDDDADALQIDGQYFFSAVDDPKISQEAFDGIRLYPPLPTTCPDPVPRSPITMTNIQSLLHDYQHDKDDIDIDDEDAASTKPSASNDQARPTATSQAAGMALELQAKRLLLSLRDDDPAADRMDEYTTQLLDELLKTSSSHVREKGFPGELTNAELEAVRRFRRELRTRSDRTYHRIVRSLREVETEAYALCRFLRARQFDVDKVFELLDVAKEYFAVAEAAKFYPDLERDMGVSRSVFLSQYPAVFCGNAKNGCPVMYLKLGSIQPEGIKCVVSLDKVDRFFWNDLLYTFTSVLKEGRRRNPDFVRTETIVVYDLKGVSRAQVTSDTFEMIKIGNQVMTSFPETLHCLLIINAPTWFGMVWSVAKKLIDPRTASKIEVFTNKNTGLKRMVELIDESQISSDCGGMGPSLAEAACSEADSKMVVLNKLIPLTKKTSENSYDFELADDKQITLSIHTRCKEGAVASLIRNSSSREIRVTEIDIFGDKHDVPYSRTIAGISGPGSFTVRLKGKSKPGVFLLLGTTTTS